jgi:hypothetical protein
MSEKCLKNFNYDERHEGRFSSAQDTLLVSYLFHQDGTNVPELELDGIHSIPSTLSFKD